MSCCMMISVEGVMRRWQQAHDCKGLRSAWAKTQRMHWEAFWRSCTDDAGKPMTEVAVIEMLREHARRGHVVIPAGKCPNWDYRTGCQCD